MKKVLLMSFFFISLSSVAYAGEKAPVAVDSPAGEQALVQLAEAGRELVKHDDRTKEMLEQLFLLTKAIRSAEKVTPSQQEKIGRYQALAESAKAGRWEEYKKAADQLRPSWWQRWGSWIKAGGATAAAVVAAWFLSKQNGRGGDNSLTTTGAATGAATGAGDFDDYVHGQEQKEQNFIDLKVSKTSAEGCMFYVHTPNSRHESRAGVGKPDQDAHVMFKRDNGELVAGIYDGSGVCPLHFLPDLCSVHESGDSINTGGAVAECIARGVKEGKTYRAIDLEISSNKKLATGQSTATTCFITQQERKIVVWNIGDSRAIVVKKDGGVVELSEDKEGDCMGAYNLNMNSFGCIQGDLLIKSDKNRSEPEVRIYDIALDDVVLLVACDGLWNGFNYRDLGNDSERKNPKNVESTQSENSARVGRFVIDLMAKGWDLSLALARTVARARSGGRVDRRESYPSGDDISVIGVDLQKLMQQVGTVGGVGGL